MRLLFLILCVLTLPLSANAEIYKWKDKDGKIRYSDVPPPSNVQQESLYGKKIPKPTGQQPLKPVEGDVTSAINRQKATDQAAKDKPLSKEEAAAQRAKDAEKQKLEDDAKASRDSAKAENCKTAQAKLKSYTDGGRLVKTNEAGEREFLSDSQIDKGKIEAQQEVAEFCND